jgi:hypothetical protein
MSGMRGDLADLLRMGRLAEAWIAPAEVRELRELTRYRAKLVSLRTSCKDQVHAVLAKLGIPVTFSDIFGKAGSAWLDGLGQAAGRGFESLQARYLRKRGFTAQHSAVRTTGARRRADRPVEDRRARPAIPRSMSFCDTCVAPRHRNGETGCRTPTGAEAFELEGMDPCYIDIDGFWPEAADIKGPESAPIAIQYYARFELRRELGSKPDSGLEPASAMLQLICRKSSWVTDVTREQDALGVN